MTHVIVVKTFLMVGFYNTSILFPSSTHLSRNRAEYSVMFKRYLISEEVNSSLTLKLLSVLQDIQMLKKDEIQGGCKPFTRILFDCMFFSFNYYCGTKDLLQLPVIVDGIPRSCFYPRSFSLR